MSARRRALLGGALAALALPAARRGSAADIVRVGATAGPQAELLRHAGELAAAHGLALQVDVRAPAGLAVDVRRGALDAAVWNDGVRFIDEAAGPGPALVVAAAMFTLPTALYARHLTSVRQLRDGDAVALPADPAGLARALVLLQNFGLLVLRDGAGLHATRGDIVANPRALRLVTLPGARLVDALRRMPVAVIDYDSAARAGLQPARDSIGIEDARTPFSGVLGVRRERLGQPWLARLVALLHGETMQRFALERYADSVRRPW